MLPTRQLFDSLYKICIIRPFAIQNLWILPIAFWGNLEYYIGIMQVDI